MNINKWLQHLKIIPENQILNLYIGLNVPLESASDFRYIYIFDSSESRSELPGKF
jgi:hypothetical protein